MPPSVVSPEEDYCYAHTEEDKAFPLSVERGDTWATYPEIISEVERLVPMQDSSAELIGKGWFQLGDHKFRELSYTVENGNIIHHRWILVTDICNYRFGIFGPSKYGDALKQDGLDLLKGLSPYSGNVFLRLEKP